MRHPDNSFRTSNGTIHARCKIIAKNDGANARNAPPEDAGGLEQEVVLAKGAKVMITRNLWQTKGYSSYCLSLLSYPHLSLGLVNGTMGTVVDVVWLPGFSRSDLPLAVLIERPTYTGPTLWNSDTGSPIVPIPVVKNSFELGGNHCSRTQVPLRLAWAVPVHKSQGLI